MLPAGIELTPLVFVTLKLAEGDTRVLTLTVLLGEKGSVAVCPACTEAVLVKKPLATVGTARKVKTAVPLRGRLTVAVSPAADVTNDTKLPPAEKVLVTGAIKITPCKVSITEALNAAFAPRLVTVTVYVKVVPGKILALLTTLLTLRLV